MDLDKVFKERSEEFEVFLTEIPILLDDLTDLLKKSNNYKDVNDLFTEDTMDKVELFYYDVIDGKEKINISINRFKRILMAYIGEFLIKKAGRGYWNLNNMKKTTHFGMIEVVDYTDVEHIPICPLKKLNAIEIRRKNTLSKDLMYLANLEQEQKKKFGFK